MKWFDTVILFGSAGFLVIWVDQFLYKKFSFGESYYLLMLALGGFLFYLYRKGLAIQAKEKENKQGQKKNKVKK